MFYGVFFYSKTAIAYLFLTNIKSGRSLSSKSACDNLASLESLGMEGFLENVDERWLLEQNIAKGAADPRELSYFAMS